MKLNLSIFCVIVLFGCKSTNIQIPSVNLTDYTFETTPNDLDNVGFVFAVDKNKVQIPITMLDLQATDRSIVVPTKNSTKKMSWGAIIKFLGTAGLTLPANAALTNSTQIQTTFSLDNPTLSVGFLIQLDSAIEKKKKVMGTALVRQQLQNADVYVVFQTIKAKKITYDFSKSKIGSGVLNASFKEILSTNDSLKWDGQNKESLTYELKKDLNVFYKVIKINVFSGASEIDFKRGEVVNTQELLYTSKK